MPNGRPGDSRMHDILHHEMEVFGPAIDALVREIDTRIEPGGRDAFIELVEAWPFEPGGTPSDPDTLLQRLYTLRERLAPPRPRPRLERTGAPPAPRAPLPPRRRGSPLAAFIGVVVGGFVGLPIGLLAYLVLRESAIPPTLWSSDGVMWAIIIAVAIPSALVGALQGGRPTRIGHALMIALLACFVGGLVCGLGAGVLALVFGTFAGVSQREGAFAMGVAFTLMPLAAVVGGVLLAAWAGRRAWRDWLG